MSRYHLSGTSRALYRVFIAPTLTPPGRFRLQHPFLLPQAARLLPQTAPFSTQQRADDDISAAAEAFRRDHGLQSDVVVFVDSNGITHTASIRTALSSFDNNTHYLSVLQKVRFDQNKKALPPYCKVLSKSTRTYQLEMKLAQQRREREKKKAAGPAPKKLEFNWAIEAGDLKHRLNRLREFLEDGKHVEVLIGPKRKGRKATEQECASLLKSMKEAVGEVDGAKESKPADGSVGGVMTHFFEGKKSTEGEVDRENSDVNRKEKRKLEAKQREEKKAERRKKMQQEIEQRIKQPADA
ncbi:hypothetical protein DM02DRAFT_611340 [Periconia macrospinosa]|uniref:Translation initiation factor 3 N-terminal domain-containing protein n=1 Tax=Periconia macrospinosa TaxID=97972 RepID=A0A2V1E2E3_9PLEO|nr:hypothetical protein DM02DRAFT_611340 [Periconia macrospinosa]